MAELRGLSVKVPIRFSEKAQKDLYETCVAYKELAEMRGAENEKLRELASNMYKSMQCVLRLSTDTVWVNSLVTLRDCMDEQMEIMAELGMPPSDYESRKRELGFEVE